MFEYSCLLAYLKNNNNINLSAERNATRTTLQDIFTKYATWSKEPRGHVQHTKATYNTQRQTFSLTGLATGNLGFAIDFTSLTFAIVSAILSALVMLGGAILVDRRPFTL